MLDSSISLWKAVNGEGSSVPSNSTRATTVSEAGLTVCLLRACRAARLVCDERVVIHVADQVESVLQPVALHWRRIVRMVHLERYGTITYPKSLLVEFTSGDTITAGSLFRGCRPSHRKVNSRAGKNGRVVVGPLTGGHNGAAQVSLHDGLHHKMNTMELSSPDSIRALIAAFGNPTLAARCQGAPNVARAASRGRRIRCTCGHCRQCLDNARWERIFVEKFADPNYYTIGVVVRIASPLTSI